MDSYGAASRASSSGGDEQAVMSQLQNELQVAYLQEFYQTVRDKCFEKCCTKPSTSLSSSEQQCIARCSDRYAEATEVVGKALLEVSGMGGGM